MSFWSSGPSTEEVQALAREVLALSKQRETPFPTLVGAIRKLGWREFSYADERRERHIAFDFGLPNFVCRVEENDILTLGSQRIFQIGGINDYSGLVIFIQEFANMVELLDNPFNPATKKAKAMAAALRKIEGFSSMDALKALAGIRPSRR